MERKLTSFGTLCFVALVGLSIGSVSCLSAVKNAKTSVSVLVQPRIKNANTSVRVLVQPRIKNELDLKVEGFYYEGQIIKYLSYMNYDSWEFNGTRKTQLVEKKEEPRLGKYIEFVRSIRQPILLPSSSILAAGNNTTSCKDDIRVRRGNLSFVWAPHKMNQTFKELLSQCDQYQWYDLLELRLGNSCLPGIHWAQLTRPGNFDEAAIPLYTVYVSTTDHILILNFNPLVNFDVLHFVLHFPFDLMETKSVVTLCGGKKKESLKTALRYRGYVVQEEVISSSTTIFVKKLHSSGATVPGKHVGYLGVVVALLIWIVGSGMGLQFGMF